jgi:hypothetical protein
MMSRHRLKIAIATPCITRVPDKGVNAPGILTTSRVESTAGLAGKDLHLYSPHGLGLGALSHVIPGAPRRPGSAFINRDSGPSAARRHRRTATGSFRWASRLSSPGYCAWNQGWPLSGDDVAALVAKVDLKNAVHIGHSTGGGEVVRLLARHGKGRAAKALNGYD